MLKFLLLLLTYLITWTKSDDILDLRRENDEQILMNSLMDAYEPSIRPVRNYSRTLNIYFRMKLMQILELSEKEQLLITNIWIEQVLNSKQN